MNTSIETRQMQIGDMSTVMGLCRQLGYETDLSSLQDRYLKIISHPEHGLFVATDGSLIIGWLHLRAIFSLEKDSTMEIAAIVVDEKWRGSGTGKMLMKVAEQWAIDQSYQSVILRSRETRTDAHRFYEQLGYRKEKSSFSFSKTLLSAGQNRIQSLGGDDPITNDKMNELNKEAVR